MRILLRLHARSELRRRDHPKLDPNRQKGASPTFAAVSTGVRYLRKKRRQEADYLNHPDAV